jgi:hypothetical protein
MNLRTTFLFASLSVTLVACGAATTKGTDAGTIITGGGTGGGNNTGGGSATGGGNGSTVDAGVDAGCTVSSSSFGALGAVMGVATYDNAMTATDPSDDIVAFETKLETGMPTDLLTVEFYASAGAFAANDGGVITAGTYAITGDELNYATCGVCVRVLTNATTTAIDQAYMATGGLVTLTEVGSAVGGNFNVSVSNLTFRHVNIDPMTFESTLASDTCASAVTSASYSGMLVAP